MLSAPSRQLLADGPKTSTEEYSGALSIRHRLKATICGGTRRLSCGGNPGHSGATLLTGLVSRVRSM